MVSTALHVTEWKYKGVCDEGRLRAVETSAPFEDIARRLEVDMEIVCCHARDCCDKPGYKRTIYSVRVAPMKRSTSCQIARTSPWLWAMIQPPNRTLMTRMPLPSRSNQASPVPFGDTEAVSSARNSRTAAA